MRSWLFTPRGALFYFGVVAILGLLLWCWLTPASAYWQSRDSSYNSPPVVSTTYTASGPTTGAAGAPSTNFTVTLGSGTFTGSQTITIADGSSSGVFTPNVGSPGTSTVTVTPVSGTNNFSFTYTARQNGIFTLTFTNAQSWTNPASLAYTATETYNVAGPGSGANLVASTPFTVTLAAGATFTGAQTITIADGSQGGTITPSVGSPGTSTVTVTPTVGLTSFTFTYTPASTGGKTLTFTNGNGSGFTDPSPLTYISGIGPLTQIMDPAGAAANSNAPTAATTTATVPIGSLVLFAAYPNTTGTTITSVTDQGTGGSNTYTVVPVTATAGVTGATVAYVASTTHTIPSGTTFTVTTSDGSQYNPRGAWFSTAYSGGCDESNFATTATVATAVAGLSTGTLTNAADLAFGYVAPFASTSGSITTPSSPWINLYNNGHTHFDYALPAATTSLAYAPTWTTSSNYSAVLLSFKPTYVGPGDVTTGWMAWHGLRAFSAATRGAALVNVCNSTGGTDIGCADLSSDPATGSLVPATVSGIACPGANCTVKTWYDQTGNLHTVTQATVSARATLDVSCIGTLPCATGVDIVNGIYNDTHSPPALVASVPWSMNSVAFLVSGSNATVQATVLQAQTTFNDRLRFVATTNLAGFECGTPVTQSVTSNNWFAMSGVCNGASGIFAVNSTTNTAQNAGSDPLVTSGSTYSVMRKSVERFVEGGTAAGGFSTGTITSLHANERTYWGF